MADSEEILPDRPFVYLGAYALCVEADRILMARISTSVAGVSADSQPWALPGGGLEWGEDPASGVLRELEEETGLSGKLGDLAGIFSATYQRAPDRQDNSCHHVGIIYWVQTLPGELRFEAVGSTDMCQWVARDELPTMRLTPMAQLGVELAFG